MPHAPASLGWSRRPHGRGRRLEKERGNGDEDGERLGPAEALDDRLNREEVEAEQGQEAGDSGKRRSASHPRRPGKEHDVKKERRGDPRRATVGGRTRTLAELVREPHRAAEQGDRKKDAGE
jgi:hypothetical protein